MNNAKQYFRIEPWKSVRALKLQLLGLNDKLTSARLFIQTYGGNYHEQCKRFHQN